MKKTTLTSAMIAAALLGCGVAAQAQTTYYYSTQTYPSYSYSYSVPVQPAVVATAPSYSYSYPSYSYSYPSSTYSYVYTQPYQAPSVTPYSTYEGTSASVTTDVPTRAGEATTYTNGAPNLLAQNWGYSTPSYGHYYYYPY